jgi:hypothetical protein
VGGNTVWQPGRAPVLTNDGDLGNLWGRGTFFRCAEGGMVGGPYSIWESLQNPPKKRDRLLFQNGWGGASGDGYAGMFVQSPLTNPN